MDTAVGSPVLIQAFRLALTVEDTHRVCHPVWTLVPPSSKPSSWAAPAAWSYWVGCSLTE